MTTITPRMLRVFQALSVAALGAIMAVGCAAPPEDGDDVDESQDESTGTQSQELQAKPPPGGGSTCVSRYQSCYTTCSVAYPDGRNRQLCFEICDDIYRECTGGGIIYMR